MFACKHPAAQLFKHIQNGTTSPHPQPPPSIPPPPHHPPPTHRHTQIFNTGLTWVRVQVQGWTSGPTAALPKIRVLLTNPWWGFVPPGSWFENWSELNWSGRSTPVYRTLPTQKNRREGSTQRHLIKPLAMVQATVGHKNSSPEMAGWQLAAGLMAPHSP